MEADEPFQHISRKILPLVSVLSDLWVFCSGLTHALVSRSLTALMAASSKLLAKGMHIGDRSHVTKSP